jgi:hypothetical protein
MMWQLNIAFYTVVTVVLGKIIGWMSVYKDVLQFDADVYVIDCTIRILHLETRSRA